MINKRFVGARSPRPYSKMCLIIFSGHYKIGILLQFLEILEKIAKFMTFFVDFARKRLKKRVFIYQYLRQN